MIHSENVLLVTDPSEVDPQELARFRDAARSPQFDAHRKEGTDLTARELVAVDPASNAVVGEISWREIRETPDDGVIAIFNRLVVAEGRWTEVSEALALATATELKGGSIGTAVVPGHMEAGVLGAVLDEFDIRWLYQD